MIKDSKLFGKINVIDLCIVIALIGAAVFGIYQFRSGDGIIGAGPETKTFIMSFYAEEIENFSAYAMNANDRVFDHGRNVALGEIIDIEINDAVIWNADQFGNTVQSNKDGFSSVEVFTRLDAVPSEHGIMIAGNRYGIGHSLTIRAGRSTIHVRISGLEEV